MEQGHKIHSGWLLLWGILLIILGVVAISYSAVTTIASVIFFGCLLLIGGLLIILDSFKYLKGKGGTFFTHLLMGILYLIIGGLFIWHPVWTSTSLTVLLACFFVVIGLFRIIFAIFSKPPRWGWVLFNGVITFLLGILIMAHWPASSLIVIGIFIGIDLLIMGWTYIMIALAARAVQQAK